MTRHSPLVLLAAVTLLTCIRQFQADAKEVTRQDIQQYLTPDKVDSSVAFIESTIGHALADRDLCVATALEASTSASTDEEFFNRVDQACGFSFESLLLGYQAAQEDGERPAERIANLNSAPSSSNIYGAIGITSKVNTGSCAKVDRWYTIMAGGCTRCYELQPIINSFGPCGTSNFSLNPFPRGKVYLSFNLDCTSSKSGTLYLYDTPCSLFGPMPEPAKIMKLPGAGKSSCFETSPFSTENVYQGSTNFKFTCQTALCRPRYTMQVDECERRINVCGKKYGIDMKWTAAGCQVNGTNQGDGGCQCNDYCGYTCESRCNADGRCSWNRANNACYYKARPTVPGLPEPFCETKSKPPSNGVVPIQVVTCFAGSATVLTEDGNRIPMNKLRVGQRVEVADYVTGQKQFSPIIAFQHVGRDTETEFLKVIAEDGSSMMLSPDHVIFASIDGAPVRPMLADMLIPGKSSVWKSDSSTSMKLALVTKIDRVHARGFYAPLTFEGTIVVDGILASCYAGYWHKVMHVLFAPYRMFRRLFPVELREEDPLPGDGFMNYVENIFAFDAMFPTKENFRYR